MSDNIVIKPHSHGDSALYISRKFAFEYGLNNKKRGYMSFGLKKSFVDIIISERPSDNEILLHSTLIDELHIPRFVEYEVKVKDNEIAIGPCIGILASTKEENLTKRRLEEIAMNALDYSIIHGAILAFSLDKVNPADYTVEGYCYNPITDSWERGVYPYPLAIYNRSRLDDKWQNHFLTAIGDTVFNNYHFDKWQMYEWFSKEPEIRPHLPHTVLFESKQDLLDMVRRFKKVYVKPIWGMKGFGVIKVSSKGDNLVFKFRKDDENIEMSPENTRDMNRTISKLFSPKKCIIQQGLDLINYNGGVVDFRMVMQKNEYSEWVCNCIVARTGAKESVVSNISSGGFAFPAIELIKNALSIPDEEVFLLKERMISLCMKICRILDKYGFNFGTLGMDLGLDKDKNIWLIEINNRSPHPAIALRVNDLQSYYSILTCSLHYAKALAGFSCKEEEKHVLQDSVR